MAASDDIKTQWIKILPVLGAALLPFATAAFGADAPLGFVPITPCRIADTRTPAGPFGAPSIAGQTTRDFVIPNSTCSIPATAQAYSLNFAVVPVAALGYLTVWPTGQPQPLVSTLNSDGRIKSNAAIVPAGTNGAISVFASNTTQVVIDIDGYFVPASTPGALAFYPVTPCRITDTRLPANSSNLNAPFIPGQQPRDFAILAGPCSIPPTAKSYSLNVTAIPHGPLGYLTTWSTGQPQPLVSTLNASTGAITANAALVPAGTSGAISIFVSNDADLVLDINGYFAPPGNTGALSYYTVTPCRVLDTRLPAGSLPFAGTLDINMASSVCAPPAAARAYGLNATVVPPGPLGYLTLWPHGSPQPVVSTLNASDGAITGNMALVPTNDGLISAFASNPTQLIVDLFGYFAPNPALISVSPNSAQPGQTATVTITSQSTNFVQGTTTASFGDGISVGSAAAGTAGPVTVLSATSATASITVSAAAIVGTRTITASTGTEAATLPNGFTITAATAPSLQTLSLNLSTPGQALPGVVITGVGTHFAQGVSAVNFGNASVSASAISVTDNTHLTATLTFAAAVTAGSSTMSVVTGTETAIGTLLLTVGAGTPVITTVAPATIQQGQSISVAITGQNTHFVQGTTTGSLGTGITVNALTVNSLTSATAAISVLLTAVTGSRAVTLTTGTEIAALASAFTITAAPPAISITSPANLSYLNITPATVNGTVSDPTATVVINGLPATVASGKFSVPVPLAEGPNIITATATSTAGIAGSSSIQLTLDTTPPHVTITNPPDQFVTTNSSITIGGSINDIVVGTVNAAQAQVTVNGTPAQVSNRMFLANAIPLVMGSNVIQAVGRDQAGNAATTQITVIRQAPAARPQISLISGDGQTGAINSVLPTALVVALKDGSGNPVPNQPVIFKVDQNNGMVAPSGTSTGTPAATVVATTNAAGQAQAQWTLGGRAGVGGNTVEAYAVGYSGTALFTATGTQGPAGMIVIDTGNNQTGAINQPLPKPLIAVVIDAGNNRLANVPVTFTVKQGGGNIAGQQSITAMSNSDGRVSATLTVGFQEGNLNNLVEANFPSNTGYPATFTASGRAAGPAANTVISGTLLDNSNQPIPGVTIRAVLTNLMNSSSGSVAAAATVQTNAQGQFSISPAPVGFVKLLVDGSTATKPGTYPTLDYDMVTIAGQTNTLGLPIFLLPLTTVNQLCVTPTTGGGTLTMPEAPGFSLTFGPGQVTFPGGSKTGCVSVTVVHPDKIPMTPGFGQQPRFIVTIQPSGALFNPPAPLTLPNVDGLKPRGVAEMYSFDHDIGSFVAIGTGTVSDDGFVVRSNSGVGVIKAGWHCGGNPMANGTVADCAPCNYCNGNVCIPDPNQLNNTCGGSYNNCIVPGTGTCGAGGQCLGGQNQPPGTACNSGGSSQAKCNATGQCVGYGNECPSACTPTNVCLLATCSGGVCQPPVPQLAGSTCNSGGSVPGGCDGNGRCAGTGNQCPQSCHGGACVDGMCSGCTTQSITASDDVSIDTPQTFPGEESTPFDPSISLMPGQHLAILYADVVNLAAVGSAPFQFGVNTFNVSLVADVTCDQSLNPTWQINSGPPSGSLNTTAANSADFQSPSLGGVYKVTYTPVPSNPVSEANIVLPLAGADVTQRMITDITLANQFAAKVTAKYTSIQLNNPFFCAPTTPSCDGAYATLFAWFYNHGMGDYLGRPNSQANPTVRLYNQVSDDGFGSVATWYGVPVKTAKMSNFIVAYAMQKIGIVSPLQVLAQLFGTSNDASGNESWQAGVDLASGRITLDGVKAYVKDIFNKADPKNTYLWPNMSAADNFVPFSSLSDPITGQRIADFDLVFSHPGFLELLNP